MRTLAFVLAFVAVLPAVAQERQEDTITFELEQNVIFVSATINGQGPFRFIFDTGASLTLIRPDTAERLGLIEESERPSGILSFLGVGAKVVTLESISLGEAAVQNLDVVSMAVPQAEIPLQMAGIPYDGLLGYNFISRFVTTIDYGARTIRLVPSSYDPGPLSLENIGGRQNPPRAHVPPPERRTRPWIGLSHGEVEGPGVRITAIAENSPAAQADLRVSDVILRVGRHEISDGPDYRATIRALTPGQEVRFRIRRGEEELTNTVRVGGGS